ncbi:hypothetical protein Tco_1523732 [Tanacetum coccineum]
MNVVTRSNGQKRSFSTLIGVLSVFDREDLNAIYKLVMDIYQDRIPKGFDKVLWGDLIVMFNPDEQDEFWNSQHEWKVISWKLHSSSGVHTLMTDEGLVIHMLIEKKYPLKKEIVVQMLKLKLESEEESTMALELIRFIKKVRILQKSQENGQNRTNTDIGKEREYKSQDNTIKGLWYFRDSPFELVAYTDSDYAGATLDRKSTTRGCQFLGNRLISWQCKKQTVVATSTTEAKYVAIASCCRQVGDKAVHKKLGDRMERATTTASSLEAEHDSGDVNAQTRFEITSIQSNDPPFSKGYTLRSGEDSMKLIGIDDILLKLVLPVLVSAVKHMLPVQVFAIEVDKKRVIVSESSIRRDLYLDDAEGTDCLPTTTIFEELARMGYEKPSQKLTFYKAFFSPQWKYFIHTITQWLSAKSTAWNEFSCSMASLIICLATNQKFNLSKYIFDAMVKHLDGGVKFLMYPRFLQVFINQQLGNMSTHKKIFVNPFHTKKVFANMKRARKDFSGRITPLFDTMMVQPVKEIGEDSDHPTDSTQIPIIDQPSSSS